MMRRSSSGSSRPPLKSTGGSVDILEDVLHCNSDAELLIARAKRGDEPRRVCIPLQSAKSVHGFGSRQRSNAARSVNHATASRSFHVSRSPDQVFDGVHESGDA